MSDNVYDFGDIIAEANKKKQDGGDGTTEKVRLNGTYKAKVVFASAEKATQKDYPQVSLIWEVQSGPDAGASAWQNIVVSKKSMGITGRTLMSLGVTAEKLQSLSTKGQNLTDEERNIAFKAGLSDIAEDLLGLEAEIKVYPQRSNAAFDQYEIIGLLSGAAVGSVPGVPAFNPAAFALAPNTTTSVPGAFLPNVN